MEERKPSYEVIDNEGSKISVFETLDLFWTESEIFIIRNNEPLPHKTTAVVGPYRDVQSALNSIPGKTEIKDVSVKVVEKPKVEKAGTKKGSKKKKEPNG